MTIFWAHNLKVKEVKEVEVLRAHNLKVKVVEEVEEVEAPCLSSPSLSTSTHSTTP